MQQTQALAARVVARVLTGKNLQLVLEEFGAPLDVNERALLQDLAYGVLRYYGALAALVRLLTHKPIPDVLVHALAVVGAYQLQYTHAPAHAIVDNAVGACSHLKKTSAGSLINALLRRFLRDRAALFDAALGASESARYSHPQWWIDKLKQQHPDNWATLLHTNNAHPPMTLRVNTRATTVAAYLQLLIDAQIEASVLDDSAIVLARPCPVAMLPGFAAGLVSVQDQGAQFAAALLDAHDGMRVLDACSAPGGKAAHLLERSDVQLTALDLDAKRLEKTRHTLGRLHLNANCLAGDARLPEHWWDGHPFDRILADVPCTASGIVRRHPDIKWLRRPSDVQRFAAQQAAILDALWRLLAQDGKLLYATCSIFHEENQMQIKAFMARTPNARCLSGCDGKDAGQVLPNAAHDGFYYALLQKT